jgi:thiosulfate/3-mercaptopyruvate sulfurtransferase
MSVDELAAMTRGLAPGRLAVVDLRWVLGQPGAGREAYEAGHLPGAIFLDLDDDLSDPNGLGAPGRHPLPTPEAFVARMAAAGIGDGSTVVGYDDAGGWVAARLWWMLDNLGFGRRGLEGERVAVLDGGIGAWSAGGRPLEREGVTLPPAELTLQGPWSGVITRDELRSRLGSVTLLDARAAPRYCGETEPIDPVAGHIPTALSAPHSMNLDEQGRFLSPSELRARFEALGPAGVPDREVVTSCGSGTSACHHSVAMRAAGLPDPILYVGSYSDWSRSGEQIATGQEPGEPPAIG